MEEGDNCRKFGYLSPPTTFMGEYRRGPTTTARVVGTLKRSRCCSETASMDETVKRESVLGADGQ